MTSEGKNKFICQHPDINIGWHEPTEERIATSRRAIIYKCSCGEINCDKENPDFTSEAGIIQLLKLIHKKYCLRNYVDIECMEDDNGLFRDKVFKLLKEKPYRFNCMIRI